VRTLNYTFIVCILLLSAGAGKCADTNTPLDGNDADGPAVILSYSSQSAVKIPFASFMYFVPLISPTAVDVVTSADNNQQVTTVSYEKKIDSKTFSVSCEFEMSGAGFHKYIFDPNEVIENHKQQNKQGGTLTNMIDYIIFEGPGFGRVEAKGTIDANTPTVTSVELWFNARKHKSTVTIAVYEVKPLDGLYIYENMINVMTARVDAFLFRKSDGVPRMDIEVSSVGGKTGPEGFLGGLKATLANWLIKPPKVAKLGNDTMLDFGLALFEEKPAFTFPKAKNIRKTSTVEADNK